jgi:superfamily I DNA/RNA helicase
MAQIQPENPPTMLPNAVLKTFKALKQLSDSYIIWHHLAPWEPNAPDFLIINGKKKALLVKVSLSQDEEAIHAAQLILIDKQDPKLGEREAGVLRSFVNSLETPKDLSLETLIIFPNIPNKRVLESRLERKNNDPQWVGLEILDENSDDAWKNFFPIRPLDPIYLQKIRAKFSPEIVVPQEMTSRALTTRHIEAGLTEYLLDYDQEAVLKTDLELDPDSQNLTYDFRLNIINGVAGSGKTLILLYRLRLLYHLYPDKRFLVLTHNKPLIKDLESRFFRLEDRLPENIDWHTFYSWCFQLWPDDPAWVMPISQKNREVIIRKVREKVFQNTLITERKFRSEIDWIKDQNVLTKEQYLQADRQGRGFGLTSQQRLSLWDAFFDYQNEMNSLGVPDWGDVPQMIYRFIKEGKISQPEYDFILVDEAQFFASIWVQLIKNALRSKASHLFMVSDPTQGFLGRKATWKSMGIEARGRVYLLKKSYRTTQEIMQFATLFYRLRLPDEKDEDILVPNLLDMPNGAFPQMIQLNSAQDEIFRVANEIKAFLAQGVPRKDIYVLHANWQGVEALIEAINQRVGRSSAMEPKQTYPGNCVRVTTISAGPGLESPIVFLVGLRTLFEEEQSLRLSDDERADLIESNTKKVFMAATRAGQRLVFTYVGDLPEELHLIFSTIGTQQG